MKQRIQLPKTMMLAAAAVQLQKPDICPSGMLQRPNSCFLVRSLVL
jgi:hypothetical protein